MSFQFLVGCYVIVINIMIHALITPVTIGIARQASLRPTSRPQSHLMTVTVATALVLMIAHTVEIVVWSLAYAVVGAAPEGSNLLDFAFVHYTTLGYGDVTPLPEWRLIGPMTAMNGILMFGWSTAMLFEVLRKTVEHLSSTCFVPGYRSVLKIQISQFLSVQQHELPLTWAKEAENAAAVQMGQRARDGLER
jgi:hypothetical protein